MISVGLDSDCGTTLQLVQPAASPVGLLAPGAGGDLSLSLGISSLTVRCMKSRGRSVRSWLRLA